MAVKSQDRPKLLRPGSRTIMRRRAYLVKLGKSQRKTNKMSYRTIPPFLALAAIVLTIITFLNMDYASRQPHGYYHDFAQNSHRGVMTMVTRRASRSWGSSGSQHICCDLYHRGSHQQKRPLVL